MSEKSQLQYLVELIDDDTEEVRTEVMKELRGYGVNLEEDLEEYSNALNPEKIEILNPILNSNRRKWLNEKWDSIFDIEQEMDRLEYALGLIAEFQYGPNQTRSLTELLDSYTEEFKNLIPYGNESDLANFLFQEKGITGAHKDYYNPMNSNLVYTIIEKRGIPISLALIYILIGNRLGFNIKGCNFPGHFLSKIEIDEEIVLVDCFNGGRLLFEKDLLTMAEGSVNAMHKLIHKSASSRDILKRVVNNLINAYTQAKDMENAKFFGTLSDKMKKLQT
jgi:hypothetical protein